MSCVHSTPAQGGATLFLIRESPRLLATPSDVYGIMTQKIQLRSTKTLCRAGSGVAHSGGYVLLMTLCRAGSGVAHSGGYVLLMTLCRAGSGVAHSGGYVLLMTLCRAGSGVAHSGELCTLDDPMQSWIRCCTLWGGVMYS